MEQLSPCDTTIEPLLSNPETTTNEAFTLQLLKSTCLRDPAQQQKKPLQQEAHALQLEKSPCINKDPNTANKEINKILKKLKKIKENRKGFDQWAFLLLLQGETPQKDILFIITVLYCCCLVVKSCLILLPPHGL